MKRFRWHKTGDRYSLLGFNGASVAISESGFTAYVGGRKEEFGDIDTAFSWVESLV